MAQLDEARQFIRLFSDVYLLLHRVGEPCQVHLTPQSRALLLHLAWSGPLTISELVQHTGRAQSVVSEVVAGLVRSSFLSRVRDPRDRRRTLIWLTPLAHDWLEQESEPLDRVRTQSALDAASPALRRRLFRVLAEFVDVATSCCNQKKQGEQI